MLGLEVYIEKGCLACRRSLRLAEHIRVHFPQVAVRVIDMAEERGQHSHLVVATPTFVLGERVFSLGNPSKAELETAIEQMLAQGAS